MQYEVLDNLPAPENAFGKNRYPFTTMEVGQCAVFQIDTPGFSEAAVRMSANAIGRKHEKTFTSRIDRKDGVLRVWRVS
jgi:hypothetical protein